MAEIDTETLVAKMRTHREANASRALDDLTEALRPLLRGADGELTDDQLRRIAAHLVVGLERLGWTVLRTAFLLDLLGELTVELAVAMSEEPL